MPQALFRTVRWSLAGIAALLVLAIVALAVVPWNFLKVPITSRVESATGRKLEIRGDISPGLFPRPHLELQQLALANPDWASAPDMLTVDRLEVTPSLTELLQGNLVLDEISLSEPVLRLEGQRSGAGNWRLPALGTSDEAGPGGGGKAAEGSGEPNDSAPVPFPSLSISGGEVRYRPPGAEQPWVLSLDSVQLTQDQVDLEAALTHGGRGTAGTLPIRLAADIDPGLATGKWQLSDIDARINNTSLSGSLALKTSTNPPTLDGTLVSPEVRVPGLLDAIPQPPESDTEPGFSVPVLPSLTGSLQVNVGTLAFDPVTLSGVDARLSFAEHRVTLEPLRFQVGGGQTEASAQLTSTPQSISARAQLSGTGISLRGLGVGESAGRLDDIRFDLGLSPLAQSAQLTPEQLLSHLTIATARASYRVASDNGAAGSTLDFSLTRAGEPPIPVLSVSGRFQGKPLDMTVEGAPLPLLLDGLADYPLQAQAQSGDLTAWADASLGAILSPETFSGNLVLKGSDANGLERWIGNVLPPLPQYRVSGRLSRQDDRWSATALGGHIGATELTGEVHYRHGDVPHVRVDLDTGRIELAQFLERGDGDGTTADGTAGNGQGDNGSPLSALRAFDGDLDLQADTLMLPDGPPLSNLDVTGTLDAGRLELQTLDFGLGGGSWHSSLRLDAAQNPGTGAVNARFRDISLGRVSDTFSAIEERLGTMSGDLELRMTEADPTSLNDDLLLPWLGRLAIEDSSLGFRDVQADTEVTLHLQTRGLASDGEQSFHVRGEGRYDGAPFSLQFRGDPLLDVRDPDTPYQLQLTSEVVDSDIRIEGSVLRPLALRGMDLRLALSGPNPHRLTRLLGVPLPELPPYSVSGDLSYQDRLWVFSNLIGEVGDSDISGRIGFDTGVSPPHLSASLQSRSLDIADLGGLVGEPPAPSPQTDAAGTADGGADEGPVLPDEPLLSDNWQRISADVRYRGESVRAADIPLSNVVIDFVLEEGRAVFDPVRFGVGDGRVDFTLDLDTKPQPAQGTLQLEVVAVNLNKALDNWELAQGSVGTVAGQGKFWVTGSSVADLLASADGGLVLLMTGGKLNALLVELAGLDASQAFLSWLSGRDPLTIDCAYGDLQARNGRVRLDTLAVDTADTTFTGTGTINLNNEQLDVTIEAHPKDASVLSGRTPLHLGGSFGDINPGLNEGNLALRAGGSLALATLASPIAALLPLLDLGAGDEVPYCDGLIQLSREAIINQEEDQ